jgi:hypothetical protein
MGDSYRIRTELGINKSINVQLDQEFEFLEILSLKIQQTDIYTRSCADYGVLVGRITANNGFGIPNARVSIFIPIDQIDESNPIITSIYPYKSPSDKNNDGYRYNLLPYTPSYSKHAATGTLPTKSDVLTGSTAVEIYDKYYRFTTKTNDSGDYMIMGVPLGEQTIVMDVDLSDIGEFSLTPQDLIRIGLATEAQVAGNRFRTSNDLNSLPQIINLTKSAEISPLWGDPEICDISINRLDFDLRDDANVDIQPTAVFMGSVFSSPDKFRIRDTCRPRDNMGNLCGLTSGPGQILAIRQTIQQDEDGNPVLEVYELDQAGNVIDGDGTWLTELPMNLDYVITNEFGERVLSNDQSIGIPTKSKYRFKVKWTQPTDLTIQTRRPHYLLPNVKEYGWINSNTDPSEFANQINKRKQQSSYYFGLAWSGYTDGFVGEEQIDRLDEIINCDDTFYEFQFNRVYTVSSLIDQYKKGGRGRFIGIKEIDDDSCDSTINKFPVNDGFKNFDLLFFLFSIIFVVLQFVGIVLLAVAHFILYIYTVVIQALCFLCPLEIPVINVRPFGFICNRLRINCETKNFTIRLPMITYPECQSCECNQGEIDSKALLGGTSGVLSYVSFPPSYYQGLQTIFASDGTTPPEDVQIKSEIFAQAIGGNNDSVSELDIFKTPKSNVVRFLSEESDRDKHFVFSESLTVGERINVFNTRTSYFDNLNKIKVTFAQSSNLGKYHFDNTITVLSNQFYESGQLLTSVNPATTTDKNFLYTAQTINGVVNGVTGTTVQGATSVNIDYAVTQTSNQTVLYSLPTGSTITRQVYPQDREYYQVVTAITIADASNIWNIEELQTFPNVLAAPSRLILSKKRTIGYSRNDNDFLISPLNSFSDIGTQFILILQRGVDPYSPKYTNEYRLGRIFGKNIDDPDLTITAQTRLNIPIQKLDQTNISVQPFTQNGMFYPSYFFEAGSDFSGFTTSTVGYYGSLDATSDIRRLRDENIGGVIGMITRTDNDFYSPSQNSAKYDTSEDVSGASYIYSKITAVSLSPLAPLILIPLAPLPVLGLLAAFLPFSLVGLLTVFSGLFVAGVIGQILSMFFNYRDVKYQYFTPNGYPQLLSNPMPISSKTNNVIRTDRLPSSDALNGSSWETNPALLQQNNNFIFYNIPDLDSPLDLASYTTGAEISDVDISGLTNSVTVFESFSCQKMVGLDCYQGFGSDFEVNQDCTTKDAVEKGCYMFLRRPLADLGKDISNFNEWGYRFRFFYGLCRGVLSQSFMNNWINGSLYMFPIQVDTFYNKQNKVSKVQFCKDVVYFNTDSNNFYYRSSPYNNTSNTFVGKRTNNVGSINELNLLFPTTLVNLGMKDIFYSEITFDSTTKGYIIPNINPTSYGDTSDLINLFVISRITDDKFLRNVISFGDNGINQLFSRGNEDTFIKNRRIDGDLAQLMSINSEIGNINFSPEYYDSEPGASNVPATILGTASNPTIAVWFSSTTEDLQTKDYLTPGRINFRGTDDIGYYPYPYGIKSQVVPFYQWRLNNTNLIFGNQYNTWATSQSDIVQNVRYQSLDRYASDTPYFYSDNSESNDLNARGYIFNVNGTVGDGTYKSTGALKQKFVVGAPFQFYFGTIVGETALNKFKTKYSVDE